MRNIFYLIIVIPITQYAIAVDVYNINLDNLLKMQQGLGWPHSLKVAVGHEALLKLRRTLSGQEHCTVTTPSGQIFDIDQPPNSRYERWGEGCGVRIRRVTANDEGRWRLTTTRGDVSLTGWTEVYVEDDTTSYEGPTISLQDGQTHTNIELSSLDNAYCFVAKPFSDSSLVPGHCSVTLDRATRAVQGNWNVLLGIPGKVAELHVQRRVSVEAERLYVGYEHDTSNDKLNLYCNILHTSKNITFCRFQRTSSSAGYNIIDGLSDGTHSYYGDGFEHRHCGMTIERPTSQDYGTWRCSVGVQMWSNGQIVKQTPLQALISVAPQRRSRINRDLQAEGEVRTVFAQYDAEFTIMCRAEVSLRYCWFQHPNGTQFTPLPLTDQNQAFWYTGESFQTGDCGITFPHALEDDAGKWTCHMGPSDQLGLEVTDRLNLRVTGPLAAIEQEVGAIIGESITLYCHTSNGNRPLDYCRFMTPSFVGLSIDSTVTEENAILNRFYFTPGRDLDYGDCSLTINSVLQDDVGIWTCAALVNEDTVEARDTITVYISAGSSQAPLSQAGVAGMVIGLLVLVSVLAGVLYNRRHKLFPPRSNRITEHSIEMSHRTMSTDGDSYSNSSGDSVTVMELSTVNRQMNSQ